MAKLENRRLRTAVVSLQRQAQAREREAAAALPITPLPPARMVLSLTN
jgi:hypothetical protein